MTTIFLIRHALHDLGPTRLAGRTPGVALSDKGRAQAAQLAVRMEREGITALQASPQQRTRETADAIALRCGLSVETTEALDEVDFGEWACRSFEELEDDPRWAAWNAEREYASTPAGETVGTLAKRVIRNIEHCLAAHAGGRIAMITHAEVIRTAILQYLGMPFSAFTRLEIEPASISQLVFADHGAVLTLLNEKVVA